MVMNTLGKLRLSKFYDFQVIFLQNLYINLFSIQFPFYFGLLKPISAFCLFEVFLAYGEAARTHSPCIRRWVFYFLIRLNLDCFLSVILCFSSSGIEGFYLFGFDFLQSCPVGLKMLATLLMLNQFLVR